MEGKIYGLNTNVIETYSDIGAHDEVKRIAICLSSFVRRCSSGADTEDDAKVDAWMTEGSHYSQAILL